MRSFDGARRSGAETAQCPPMSTTVPLAEKPEGYYSQGREDLICELSVPLGRVLDVGCGEGAANKHLRAAGATFVAGIEIRPEPASKAAERYEQVVVGDALEALGHVSGEFDTILCYDVLEHLVDPGAVLSSLRRLAGDDSRLHVSVPNARHYSLARDLILRGTFGYTEFGHRDSTHLRWFTRSDLCRLLTTTGWSVDSTTSSADHRLRELGVRVPRRLASGVGGEFFGRSWYVLARPADE
jgi:2-polyprenyl-3-methyl-5-hydroxy-6-metoxy-1,4-benzoquinol methylase